MRTKFDTKLTVGQRLRKLRGKRTKVEVAEAIGVSESSYIKYERDERHPSDPIKKRIAAYFNSNVGDIFFS
jgi:DNA-binding XRE family transcriptional regulator